jgi:hypothetical protein
VVPAAAVMVRSPRQVVCGRSIIASAVAAH